MKRYLFFAHDCFEPMGGWGDFIYGYYKLLYKENYFQIVDSTISKIVLEGGIGDIIDGKVVDIPE